MNLTDLFLNRIDEVAQQNIPDSVYLRTKRALLDYIAVTIAGAAFQKDKLNNYVAFANPETGVYRPIGMEESYSLKDTVFLNGLNGHALDFDDGTNAGIIHLGSPIFSVLLPLAQKHGCTMKEVLRAAIIGYEASFTMAISIQPKHKAMGYHATGTCGVLGIAVAVSYLLNFAEAERKTAFAIACVSATGMLKVLDDGSELKPYNVGKTALLGLVACQMAKAGYKAHHDPLSGERGFLKMMAGIDTVEFAKPILDGTFAVEKAYTKPYAACRYCHPSIEAAILLREDLNVDDIQKIVVKTYSLAVAKHDHTDVPVSASAKMSIPYSVAVGLLYGKAGLSEYDEEHVKNEDIKSLTKKVEVYSDDDFTAAFPKVTSALVEISTIDGKIFSEQVDFPKGEPENPMSEKEFFERFCELCDFAGVQESAAIYDAVMNDDIELLIDSI